VTGERILPEHRLRLRRQTVEPLAANQWHRPRAIPGCPAALTSPRRRTRAPHPNAISMTPSRSVRRGAPSGVVSTGTIALFSTPAFGKSCRRHLNSWLLFTSWRRATIDTDAPGSSVGPASRPPSGASTLRNTADASAA
jgi:hypothetical protein